MSGKRVYLAIPYSHSDVKVREHRFRLANVAAAYLMSQGAIVFSPISHSHPIAHYLTNHLDADFWLRQSMEWIKFCNKLVVVQARGWNFSHGVGREMWLADRLGLDITYLTTKEIIKWKKHVTLEQNPH